MAEDLNKYFLSARVVDVAYKPISHLEPYLADKKFDIHLFFTPSIATDQIVNGVQAVLDTHSIDGEQATIMMHQMDLVQKNDFRIGIHLPGNAGVLEAGKLRDILLENNIITEAGAHNITHQLGRLSKRTVLWRH